MNGKDIFLGLKYVGDDLIEKAEYGQFPASGEIREKTHGRIRRPFLLAALIALLLMLVGCGIAYVLRLQDLKIGMQTVPQTQYDDSGSRIDEMYFLCKASRAVPTIWRIRSGLPSPIAIPIPEGNTGKVRRNTGHTVFRIRKWWISWMKFAGNMVLR